MERTACERSAGILLSSISGHVFGHWGMVIPFHRASKLTGTPEIFLSRSRGKRSIPKLRAIVAEEKVASFAEARTRFLEHFFSLNEAACSPWGRSPRRTRLGSAERSSKDVQCHKLTRSERAGRLNGRKVAGTVLQRKGIRGAPGREFSWKSPRANDNGTEVSVDSRGVY